MIKISASVLLLILIVACLPQVTPGKVLPPDVQDRPQASSAPQSSSPAPTAAAGVTPAVPRTGDPAASTTSVALTVQETKGSPWFSIVPVFADTGLPVENLAPIELGGSIAVGFSRDRSQMAFLSNRTEGCRSFCLRIINLIRWEEIIQPIPVEKSLSAWFTIPAFDANSSIIPLVQNSQTDTVSDILLVDRGQGKVTARVHMPAFVYQAVQIPGGSLAVYGLYSGEPGTNPLAYLALLDGKDLHLLWEKTLDEMPLSVDVPPDHSNPALGSFYQPAAVFSAEGSRLYLVAADQPSLFTVDFQKKSVEKMSIQPKTSWLEGLLRQTAGVVQAKSMNGISKEGVLSPDGQFLYVVGQEMKTTEDKSGEFITETIPLGLQVIDTRDGTLVREVDTAASQLALSPDGKQLLLTGWEDGSSRSWTDVLDLASWQVLQRLAGSGRPSRLLDGSTAWLTSEQGTGGASVINLYLPGAAAPLSKVSRDGYIDWIPIP